MAPVVAARLYEGVLLTHLEEHVRQWLADTVGHGVDVDVAGDLGGGSRRLRRRCGSCSAEIGVFPNVFDDLND